MKKPLLKFRTILKTFSPSLIIGFSFILVILTALIDYWVKIPITFSLFYLFPIFLVTWLINQKTGLLFCIVSSLALFGSQWTSTQSPNLWLEGWNTFIKFCFFVILTDFLSDLKAAYKKESTLAQKDRLTGAANPFFF